MLYWHWLIFGMLLMMVEIFLPSFTALWFGLGAVVVGLGVWLFPETPAWAQFLFWAVDSAFFTVLWFRYFKPLAVDRTKAGLSREQIVGESGHVIAVPSGDVRGKIRFAKPILGNEEWPIISESELAPGDRVYVVDVLGNSLLVEKRDSAAQQTAE